MGPPRPPEKFPLIKLAKKLKGVTGILTWLDLVRFH